MSAVRNMQRCPDQTNLERFCLTADQRQSLIAIQNHLAGCPACRAKVRQIKTFYRILVDELSTPPGPATIDFCKKLAPKTTLYGLLVCSPLPTKDDHRGRAFLATLAFSANGNGSKLKLSDYTLPHGHIGVMVYTDTQKGHLILISHSSDGLGLAYWQLSIPGVVDGGVFSGSSSIIVSLPGLEMLHNQLFFFKQRHHKTVHGATLNQICASLAL